MELGAKMAPFVLFLEKKRNHVNRLVSIQSVATYEAGPATLGGADLGCCEFDLSG